MPWLFLTENQFVVSFLELHIVEYDPIFINTPKIFLPFSIGDNENKIKHKNKLLLYFA